MMQIYQLCGDVLKLREWVKSHLQYDTGTGDLWLPIVLTAKGPLYAEVIGLKSGFSLNHISPETGLVVEYDKTLIPYQQPIHLTDNIRQPLYYLGYQLLDYLLAPPSVYLIQFTIKEEKIIFDRVFPFPHTPAIASIGVQEPDLFTCHYRCLQNKPILDLIIIEK